MEIVANIHNRNQQANLQPYICPAQLPSFLESHDLQSAYTLCSRMLSSSYGCLTLERPRISQDKKGWDSKDRVIAKVSIPKNSLFFCRMPLCACFTAGVEGSIIIQKRRYPGKHKKKAR